MVNTIYDTIFSNTIKSGLYVVPCALERFSASVGGHILNLANIDHKMFIKARIPANFRIHITYIAHSGWTKSTYNRLLLRDKYGLLWNENKFMPVDVQATFSKASWLGTARKNDQTGEIDTCDGTLTQYKRGIIGADDYQALKLMFEGEGTDQDEIALMTALDTDHAIKNLSMKKIRINNIGMTFWVGMRPCKIDMSKSGFARRFSFGYFVPNREEARMFKKLARKEIECNYELELENSEPVMINELQNTYDVIRETGVVPLELEEVYSFLDKYNIPHFEENIYRNMAIGFSVAQGSYPEIKLTKDTIELLESEILNREIMKTSQDRMMMYKILKSEPDQTIKYNSLIYFLTNYLQYREQDALWVIMNEKRFKRVEVQGIGKHRTVRLNWEPQYLQDLRDDDEDPLLNEKEALKVKRVKE